MHVSSTSQGRCCSPYVIFSGKISSLGTSVQPITHTPTRVYWRVITFWTQPFNSFVFRQAVERSGWGHRGGEAIASLAWHFYVPIMCRQLWCHLHPSSLAFVKGKFTLRRWADIVFSSHQYRGHQFRFPGNQTVLKMEVRWFPMIRQTIPKFELAGKFWRHPRCEFLDTQVYNNLFILL